MKKIKNLKRLFLLNGLLLIAVFAILQYSVERHEVEINTPVQDMEINPVAQGEFANRLTLFETALDIPNIEYKTIFNKDKSLKDLQGHWVLLNLWATWCPPCIVEMPYLQKLQDHYGRKNFKIIAVSLDRNMTGDKLKQFMNKHDFGPIAGFYGHYPTINSQLEIKGLPTSYIINPQGKAIGVYKGDTNWLSDDAKAFFDSLILR